MTKIYLFDKTIEKITFSEHPLEQGEYENCDLQGASFDGSNLEKADFRTAINYTIDPIRNRIRKAKFSQLGLAGLLRNFDIEIE